MLLSLFLPAALLTSSPLLAADDADGVDVLVDSTAPVMVPDAPPVANAATVADAVADAPVTTDAPVTADAAPPRTRPTRRPPPGATGGPPGAHRRGPPPERSQERPPQRPPESPLHPVAMMQLWGTAYDMDVSTQGDSTGYGDPEDDMGVKLKRARLGLGFDKHGLSANLLAGVTAPYDGLDTRNGEFSVYDANIGYHTPEVHVSAGLQQVPFSRDSMMSSAELTFQERGLAAEHIAPDRQLGLLGGVDVKGLGVNLGAFNSNGSLFGDDNNGKTLVGRLEYTYGGRNAYTMWSPEQKGVGFGVGGGGFMTSDVATQTVAAGGDLLLRVGGLALLGDGSWAKVSPVNSDVAVPGVFAETTRIGITGQVSYGIDAWEPAVRVSTYSDSAIGSWTQLFIGGVWHGDVDGMRDVVRVGAGYEMRLEGETSVANDTARMWCQFALPADMPHRGKRGGTDRGGADRGGPDQDGGPRPPANPMR